MTDIVTGLQDLTQGLPPFLRWVGVLLAGAIPYVEAEGAAVLGVVAGVNPFVAIPVARVGPAIARARGGCCGSGATCAVSARRLSRASQHDLCQWRRWSSAVSAPKKESSCHATTCPVPGGISCWPPAQT